MQIIVTKLPSPVYNVYLGQISNAVNLQQPRLDGAIY